MIDMKKNKGFTLIELLSVIVILAIIALIAVPQVIKIINNVRKNAAIDSAYGIVSSAEHYVSSYLLDSQGKWENKQLEFNCKNNSCKTATGEEILYDGKKATSGKVIISSDGKSVSLNKLVINNFTCNKKMNEDTVNCDSGNGEVVDTNSGVICGDGKVEDYDGNTECYIKSIADYKSFYSLVNSGKDFSGKTVYLMKDLNFEKETNIEPIGNNTNKFAGTFKGNGNTISNVTINGNDYVGLFGYLNNGTIEGINVENININATGDNVGGLVGYINDGNINEVTLYGNITATGDNVGSLVGYNNNTTNKITSILVNSNVTGNNNVGGIAGYSNSSSYYKYATITGVVESGTITATGSSARAGNGLGYQYCSGQFYISNSIVLNSSTLGNHGDKFDVNYIGDLSYYETLKYGNDFIIETSTTGDINNSGYIFGYQNINGINKIKIVKAG